MQIPSSVLSPVSSVGKLTAQKLLPTITSVSNPQAKITQYQGADGLGLGVFRLVRVEADKCALLKEILPQDSIVYAPTTDEPVSYSVNATQIADRSTGDFMDELNSLGSALAIQMSNPIGYLDERLNNMMFDISIPGFYEEIEHIATLGQQDVQTRLDTLFKQEGISNTPPVTFKVVVTDGALMVKAEGEQADKVDALLTANPDLATRIRTAIDVAEQAESIRASQEKSNKYIQKFYEKDLEAANKFFVESTKLPEPKVTFSYGVEGLKALFGGKSEKQWQSVFDELLDRLMKEI